jgi:hypothetical protein
VGQPASVDHLGRVSAILPAPTSRSSASTWMRSAYSTSTRAFRARRYALRLKDMQPVRNHWGNVDADGMEGCAGFALAIGDCTRSSPRRQGSRGRRLQLALTNGENPKLICRPFASPRTPSSSAPTPRVRGTASALRASASTSSSSCPTSCRSCQRPAARQPQPVQGFGGGELGDRCRCAHQERRRSDPVVRLLGELSAPRSPTEAPERTVVDVLGSHHGALRPKSWQAQLPGGASRSSVSDNRPPPVSSCTHSAPSPCVRPSYPWG